MRALLVGIGILVLGACADASGPSTDASLLGNVVWIDDTAYLPTLNAEALAPGDQIGVVEHIYTCSEEPAPDAMVWESACPSVTGKTGIGSNTLPLGTPIHAAEDHPTSQYIMALDGEEWLLLVESFHGVTGTIVGQDLDATVGAGMPNIHVKEGGHDGCGVIFAVAEATRIERVVAGSASLASVEDLEVGQDVRVFFPDIAESCPAQGIAYVIHILVD